MAFTSKFSNLEHPLCNFLWKDELDLDTYCSTFEANFSYDLQTFKKFKYFAEDQFIFFF